MLLLSGDVHWAQLFSLKCTSYTGYNIYEFCSSGLTHEISETSHSQIDQLMDGHTPNFYKESPIHMIHNFGTIEIERSKVDLDDIIVNLAIRNSSNH